MRRSLTCLLLAGCAAAPPVPSPTPVVRVTTTAAMVTPTPTPTVDVARLIQDGQDQVLLGKPQEAQVKLQQAVAAEPDNEGAHYWLMMAYQKQPDQMAQAAAEARLVMELAPDSAHADEAKGLLSLSKAPALKGSGKRPKDVSGFEKAKLGMTETEVRRVYPDQLQPFKGRYQNPGKHVPFSFMRRFGGQDLEVLFPFDDETGQLVGIYIRPKNYPSGSQREFDELLATLTGLYGPPDGNENLEGMVSRQRQVWNFTSARVHLNLYQGGDLSITILRP